MPIIVLAALAVGYYFYLSNRDMAPKQQNTTNSEITKIVTRNLDGQYYPQFPRDVVLLYAKIVKEYYGSNVTETDIELLGKQARKLFDEELLEKNPEDEFFTNLKADIKAYNDLERIITNIDVEKANDVKVFTFEEKSYATVKVGYLVREKSSVDTICQQYTLRKDDNGQWKILYWESYVPDEDDE